MSDAPGDLEILAALVARLRAGDLSAREPLINHACERLRRIVRKQLRSFPAVRRWEETGDVLQSVMLRLCRALEEVRPNDVREFFALSGTLIRRELIDLKRHYYGAEGLGAHHATKLAANPNESRAPNDDPSTHGSDPARAVAALELHEHVEKLPPELGEVVTLLWYQGRSQDEAAALLGTSTKTIGRRWRDARLQLGRWLRE